MANKPYRRRDTIKKSRAVVSDYDKAHPRLPIRFTSDQLDILRELAAAAGMAVGPYIRDVALRQHIEALNHKWPEGHFGNGEKTEWGGRRRGSGRKPALPKD